jgi:hypothetical protein
LRAHFFGKIMKEKIQLFLSKLGRFKWTAHNCIGHPFMEIFYLLGLDKLAEEAHDITMPKENN